MSSSKFSNSIIQVNFVTTWIWVDIPKLSQSCFIWKNSKRIIILKFWKNSNPFTGFWLQIKTAQCFSVLHSGTIQYKCKFHWKRLEQFHKSVFVCFLSEPISTLAPRLELSEKLKLASIRYGHTTSLLCPVQSFPTPSYR